MTLTTLRQDIVTQAQWVLNHGSEWKYEEIRPISLANIKAGRLPVYTDCSGSIIGIYYRAGAPDPGGYDYNGSGNTDSFLSACEHIPQSAAEPGDIVDVTTGADHGSVHAYLVMEKHSNGDFTVFSHGGPLNTPPKTELLSSVTSYWHANGYHFQALRRVPENNTITRWTVLNGRGERIGRTIHPAVWGTRHALSFRKFGQVRYMRHKV